MRGSEIVITRESALSASMKTYRVELDGVSCGKLKNGGTLVVPAVPGSHTLSFYGYGKCEKTVVVYVAHNADLYIRAKLNAWSAKIELDISQYPYPDNHKKKNNAAAWMCIALCAMLLLTLSLVADYEQKMPASQIDENITPEQRTEIMLGDAKEQFAGGNYTEGFAICYGIVADYPESKSAADIDKFIQEQLQQYTKITAVDLMNAYETNIVNADKQYNGKPLIVSGTVSKIDKVNNDKDICVLLRTNTWAGSVQLNFNDDQEDAVAALKPGDWITSIGECTGKSGRQLIVFDGNNVMLHDCLILK